MHIAYLALLVTIVLATASFDYTASLYSAAAYCNPDRLDGWRCEPMCANYTLGTSLLHRIIHHPSTDTTGYIAINHSNKLVIVAFRGSLTLLNWIGNLKTWHHKAPWNGTDAHVHSGFLHDYLSVAGELRDQIGMIMQAYPVYTLLFTGHSLGGALATLAAVDIAGIMPSVSIKLITFGAPRVGDENWSKYLSDSLEVRAEKSRRWVNRADLVPHLPPRSFGFHQSPQEHWVSLQGDIIVCSETDGEDAECSGSLIFAHSLVDHLSIFGHLFGPFC